jgi:hypothetical protein
MIDNKVARAFGLDAAGWARHANPWSVYTRIPVPVLLAAAVWTTRAYGAFDRRTACGGGVRTIWKTKPSGTVNRQNRAGT